MIEARRLSTGPARPLVALTSAAVLAVALLGPAGACAEAPGEASAGTPRISLQGRAGVQEMILSVKFPERTVALYEEVAQWQVLARHSASGDGLARHWGLADTVVIDEALMGVPGTDKGFVRLVHFHDVEQQRIRSSARAFDTGGIFNINALVRDLEGVFEHLRDHGFQGFADPTYYTLFGRRYGGALLRGHDDVVINLLHRVDGNYDDLPAFGSMSHVFNATQIVRDFEAAQRFFIEDLGWEQRWEASPTWPEDGANNMGVPNNLITEDRVSERAASFAISPDADGGTVEIFHFEGITGRDYAARAKPPNLGILMYRIHVPDLAAYAAELEQRGVSFTRPRTRLVMAPYGEVEAFVVTSPDGAWLEFFQQL